MNEQVVGAGFQLLKGPGGLVLAPAPGGNPLGEEEIQRLSQEERSKLARTREHLQREIEERLRSIRRSRRERATRCAAWIRTRPASRPGT